MSLNNVPCWIIHISSNGSQKFKAEAQTICQNSAGIIFLGFRHLNFQTTKDSQSVLQWNSFDSPIIWNPTFAYQTLSNNINTPWATQQILSQFVCELLLFYQLKPKSQDKVQFIWWSKNNGGVSCFWYKMSTPISFSSGLFHWKKPTIIAEILKKNEGKRTRIAHCMNSPSLSSKSNTLFRHYRHLCYNVWSLNLLQALFISLIKYSLLLTSCHLMPSSN